MATFTSPDLGVTLLAGDSDPNFLPCPKITLFVDPNILGSCGICNAQLEFRSEEDKTPMPIGAEVSIVPCGHLACYACMTECLRMKPECPFCRLSLQYEFCPGSHSLTLCRPITKESLFSVPDTLPMGGKISDQCGECRVHTNKLTSDTILDSLADAFKKMRAEYQRADEPTRIAMQGKIQKMQHQFKFMTEKLSNQAVAGLGMQW